MLRSAADTQPIEETAPPTMNCPVINEPVKAVGGIVYYCRWRKSGSDPRLFKG